MIWRVMGRSCLLDLFGLWRHLLSSSSVTVSVCVKTSSSYVLWSTSSCAHDHTCVMIILIFIILIVCAFFMFCVNGVSSLCKRIRNTCIPRKRFLVYFDSFVITKLCANKTSPEINLRLLVVTNTI